MEVVSHIYHSFFGKFVELPIYHDRNYELAQTQGYLEIPPLGRRRYFPVQPPPYTEVANYPIQSSGSDYVTMEMVQMQEELDRRFHGTANQILHGHDATYIECNASDAEEISAMVRRMFGTTLVDGPAGPVTLTCDIHIGRNLQEAK